MTIGKDPIHYLGDRIWRVAIGGGWGEQDDAVSFAALHRALDMGVDFIDTAAVYGKGHSERLIGRVLRERGEKVTVATKTPPTKGPWPPSPYCRWQDRYPEKYLRQNVEQRLRNLGRDCIDLLQLHSWTRNCNSRFCRAGTARPTLICIERPRWINH